MEQLPELFNEAELKKSWLPLLKVLQTFSEEGFVDPIPDWLAVEIIWLNVQLNQQLPEIAQQEKKTIEEYLDFLGRQICWQQAQLFDKSFALLDQQYLQEQGISAGVYSLGQFLSHPASREVSPHRLFGISYYRLTEKLDKSPYHPLVHFFRHNNGYQAKSSNPNYYFDSDWYRNNFLKSLPDKNPLLHYIEHFREPNIRPSEHFYNDYVRHSQNLPIDIDPLEYYLKQLQSKGRIFCYSGFSPCPYFDRSFYLAVNHDIKKATHDGQCEPFLHFSSYGINESRKGHVWLAPNIMSGTTSDPGNKKIAVLVLGMHRSGTSALTKVLNLLGFDLSSHLMEANFANQTGYWECSKLATEYHDPILASFNSSWDDIFPIAKHHKDSDDWERYRFILKDYLVSEFAQSDHFVLKDPRMCKLVPLWLDVMSALDTQVKIIIPFRNPLEVAESLNARDGFSQEKSFMLWLRHILDAEFYTRGTKRCFVNYADLLSDPIKVIESIGRCCEMAWPNVLEQVQPQIADFLDTIHYHQRINDDQLLESDIPEWVLQVYDVLKRLSVSVADDLPLKGKLDEITKQIDRADDLHGKIIAEKQRDLQDLFTFQQGAFAKIQQSIMQNESIGRVLKQNHLC